VVDTIHEGKVLFKGGEPDDFDEGKIISCHIVEANEGVSLSKAMMEHLQAKPAIYCTFQMNDGGWVDLNPFMRKPVHLMITMMIIIPYRH
jgi:hypothetical protein